MSLKSMKQSWVKILILSKQQSFIQLLLHKKVRLNKSCHSHAQVELFRQD